MISSLFWDITQRTLAPADVSGQPIGPIFKGHNFTIVRSPVDMGSVLTYPSWLQYANLHLFVATKTVNSSAAISSLQTARCSVSLVCALLHCYRRPLKIIGFHYYAFFNTAFEVFDAFNSES